MTPFDVMSDALQAEGYVVRIKEEVFGREHYRFARVTGGSIYAGFCEPSAAAGCYLDNRISADHERCFDKWSKCPLVAVLPSSPEEAKAIVAHLRKLGTPEGYELSNSYGYLNNNPFPREV
jgi:hypothetical protein